MVKSLITASEHGCESDDGFGKGKKFEDCAASGASHGGVGGHGGIETTDSSKHTNCKDEVPGAYYSGNTVKYEGSGGASGTEETRMGGQGGGIIMLNTLQTTDMDDTQIEANGGDG